MDVVLQAPGLADDAVHAFAVALAATGVRRRPHAARLEGVQADEATARIVAALAAFWSCDAALVPPGLHSGQFRVLAMDMDSTVITIECIDELARLAGRGQEVAAITEAAMQGRIADYAQSLRERVALLAGCNAGLVQRVIGERLEYSPGARDLLREARALGWRTLLVSGGFTVFAEHVRAELGFDEICANVLTVADGVLTGEVQGPGQAGGRIVDGAGKAAALEALCRGIGCDPSRAVAVGDGANDLPMMALAGWSVAYHAKPQVRAQARCALDHGGLDGLLLLLADRW